MKKSLLSLLLVISGLSACYPLEDFLGEVKEEEKETTDDKETSDDKKQETSDDKDKETSDDKGKETSDDKDKEVTTYQISWQVEGEIVRTDTVEEGKMPSFGSTPYKEPPSATVQYAFSNWEPALEVASKDMTYTAIFVEEPRKYNISFDINGVTVESKDYEYNQTPSFTNPNNVIDADNYYHQGDDIYRFNNKWEPNIGVVTKDQKYVADITKMKKVLVHYYPYSNTNKTRTYYSPTNISDIDINEWLRLYTYDSETNKMTYFTLAYKETSNMIKFTSNNINIYYYFNNDIGEMDIEEIVEDN